MTTSGALGLGYDQHQMALKGSHTSITGTALFDSRSIKFRDPGFRTWIPEGIYQRQDAAKYFASRCIEIALGNPPGRNIHRRFCDFMFAHLSNPFTQADFLGFHPIPYTYPKEIAKLCIKRNPTEEDINNIQSSLNAIYEIIDDEDKFKNEAARLFEQHRPKFCSWNIPLPEFSLKEWMFVAELAIMESSWCLEEAVLQAKKRQSQACPDFCEPYNLLPV